MPAKKEDLPSTLERSPKKVRDTYEKTLDSAHEEYDSEERAHRTAWSAVKHVAEKKGDHWEPKDEKGPSDPQAERERARGARPPARDRTAASTPTRRRTSCSRTPARPDISGRSSMNKDELADALRKHNDRETAAARAEQGATAERRAERARGARAAG